MKHIVLIDPLEKLTVKKDSSLQLALALKEKFETYIMFASDLCFDNSGHTAAVVHGFEGEMAADYSVGRFEITSQTTLAYTKEITIHMRLDPPVDGRYLRVLWILKGWQDRGIQVINSAAGILKHNEKMAAYALTGSIDTFVGGSLSGFLNFVEQMDSEKFILKPMDLYQGLGIRLVNRNADDLTDQFQQAVNDCGGTVVVQPFIKDIENGEVRSIWFAGNEIGNILKIPKSDSYLANIAQGAKVENYQLPEKMRSQCQAISKTMLNDGVDWLAFDILGGVVSEINLTCPGLLVEVSQAVNRDLAKDIVRLISN